MTAARFPRLDAPVAPPAGRTYVTPCRFDEAAARAVVEQTVFGRWLRPADARLATRLATPERLWVPFWRVEVRLDGSFAYVYGERFGRDRHMLFEKRVDGRTVGGVGFVSFDGDKGFSLVCARRSAPMGVSTVTEDDVYEEGLPRWHLEPGDLVPLEAATDALGPDPALVDADLDEERACIVAKRAVLGSVGSDGPAFVLKRPKVSVVGSQLVYLPCYFAPYEYAGEAAPKGGEFVVVLSGRTGAVLAHRHPSSLRAVAARLRRILSFDKGAFR